MAQPRRFSIARSLALTAFLMFVITAVATDTRAVGPAAAIAIGATVGLDALFGGSVTGASMNPARSLGPAITSGTWTDFWIYLAGPIIGAAAGALAYQAVRGQPTALAREPRRATRRRARYDLAEQEVPDLGGLFRGPRAVEWLPRRCDPSVSPAFSSRLPRTRSADTEAARNRPHRCARRWGPLGAPTPLYA
jgi:hypothetical protein